jgi:TRAP-type C4-dicarboxylate transport system substrate-binding protein
VQTGIAHQSHIFTGYYPSVFDLLDCIALPFMAPNAEVASRAAWDLYQKYPEIQTQMKAAKVMAIWATEPYFFLTTKKQIKTLADFKGMKIRIPGGPPTDMVKALDGTPVLISMNDVYLSLQKGVIDGLAAPSEAILGYRLYEVGKYYTYVPTVTVWFFNAMNWDTWNGFPKDIQDAIWSVSGVRQTIRYGAEVFDGARKDLKPTVTKAGHEIVEYTMPKEEVDNIVKVAGKPIWDSWVNKMEAKGIKNAKNILADCQSLIAQYSKEPSKAPVSRTIPLVPMK